ncbi:MAG: hypothetical protein KBC64_06115 [Simkaniaceae bacterium]|nr:hypothetical protein [Simkaniaceae bacterium]
MDVAFSGTGRVRFGMSYSGRTEVVSDSGNEGIVEGIRVKFPSHPDEEVIVGVLPRPYPSAILATPWLWDHVSLNILKGVRGRPTHESVQCLTVEESPTIMKTMQLFLRVKHSDRPSLSLYPIAYEVEHFKADALYQLHVALSEEGAVATFTEVSEEEEKTKLQANAAKILRLAQQGYQVAIGDHAMSLSRQIDILLDSSEPPETLRRLAKQKISAIVNAFAKLHAFHPDSLPPLDPDLDKEELVVIKTECDELHSRLLDSLEERKTQAKVPQRFLDISYDARSYPELERLFRLFAALVRKLDKVLPPS